ncbi:MAG: lasso RiPP family leader peptide-containing protein [Anaerolineales bacterium]|nr:lasso RiPP family leader peptide-containing protein [Anaerolineales bacterium]MDL1924880.1 lasso RiPP family leader peptide-containing protein [Anaerolineae bacterium AMX1]WKZ50152.1 MAG: lasso RiPP family leader peptide-containing protein [Anaerolineales bacterium]WKZ53067.1 MAG: lasso RiPP family leader peptide-containing protein [Anaerolineales bacterium]
MPDANLNEKDRNVSGVVARRRYRKPLLERLGELRALTLGGSPGVGDSVDPLNRRPPNTPIPPGFLPPDDPFQF